MDLKQYYEKQVIIISEGEMFVGTINDYFESDDNEDGLESIVMDTTDGDIIEFNEERINKIIII